MICKSWDIVLTPYPFTDLSTTKQRPAIVVSPISYNTGLDIIVMYLTSKISESPNKYDHILTEWKNSGLPLPSMSKMKFMTLDRDLLIKKIGEIQEPDKGEIKLKLKDFFSL